jgi:hypothetical protein
VSSPIGGEMLTDCLLKTLESKGIVVSCFCLVSSLYAFENNQRYMHNQGTVVLAFTEASKDLLHLLM